MADEPPFEHFSGKVEPASESTADRLLDTLEWTPENMLIIARAFLDDPAHGDVSATLRQQFSMSLDPATSHEVITEIEHMRRSHFAKLGKPVPPDEGGPFR